MKEKITNTVLMVEPIAFGYNKQTATDNIFQKNDITDAEKIQQQALGEFTLMVKQLRKLGVNVIVVKDTQEPHTPDSIFPNNWVTFHSDGSLVLYPMFAKNRREERREEILKKVEGDGFYIRQIIDYTQAEQENIFLEGTGSMVLDRANKIAYASISERTHEFLFLEFCKEMQYTPISFHASQKKEGKQYPIYHTNVMMGICDEFTLICLDVIPDKEEKERVFNALSKSRKEIIPISEKQMNLFLGNTLQLESSTTKEKYLIISKTAYQSLAEEQINKIQKYTELLICDIPTIEKYGGGSVRCMLAEIFLPKRTEEDSTFFN